MRPLIPPSERGKLFPKLWELNHHQPLLKEGLFGIDMVI
jgi:hypothetical protein